jgi:hypothetical protein
MHPIPNSCCILYGPVSFHAYCWYLVKHWSYSCFSKISWKDTLLTCFIELMIHKTFWILVFHVYGDDFLPYHQFENCFMVAYFRILPAIPQVSYLNHIHGERSWNKAESKAHMHHLSMYAFQMHKGWLWSIPMFSCGKEVLSFNFSLMLIFLFCCHFPSSVLDTKAACKFLLIR